MGRALGRIARVDVATALFLVSLLCCLVIDFFLARSVVPNSDTIQLYNEIPSIRAGNILLRHWVLTSDSFYLTDLPFFVLFSFLIGDVPQLAFVVPFFIFVLFLTACLLLVQDDERSSMENNVGRFSILFLLGLPFAWVQCIYLSAAIHVATLTFCLYAVLIVRPILRARRVARPRLLAFSTLVLAATASDPFATVVFVIPFLLFLVVRAWLSSTFRLDDVLLALCLLASTAGGGALVHLVSSLGGFTTNSSFTMKFVASPDYVRSNMIAIRGALEVLANARAALLQQLPAHRVVAFTRSIACVSVIALCCRVLWRLPRTPCGGVAPFLALAPLCLLTLDAISRTFTDAVSGGVTFPGAAVRYVMPAYVFGSIAAAIEFQRLFPAVRHPVLRPAGLLIGAAFVGLSILGAAQVAADAARLRSGFARAPQSELAAWLHDHHFSYGVGDYWTTQMVQAITRSRVVADPVMFDGETLVPLRWISDVSRFDRHKPPQFIAYMVNNRFGITQASVQRTFGTPRKVYRIGNFVVAQLTAPDAPEP